MVAGGKIDSMGAYAGGPDLITRAPVSAGWCNGNTQGS